MGRSLEAASAKQKVVITPAGVIERPTLKP
jgi:hypothetical protein